MPTNVAGEWGGGDLGEIEGRVGEEGRSRGDGTRGF